MGSECTDLRFPDFGRQLEVGGQLYAPITLPPGKEPQNLFVDGEKKKFFHPIGNRAVTRLVAQPKTSRYSGSQSCN
jgi:hypothetical protein